MSNDLNLSTPPADFDWDNTGKTTDVYKSDDKAKMEAMYDGTLSQIEEHVTMDGTVISLTDKEAIINIGFKSDGMVPLSEFRHMPDLKPGDKVEVYVETKEDKGGQLILSHKKARALKSWERVNASLEKDEIIQGLIKCRTKGGLIVDVFGIEAFLPGSQIDVKPIRDYDVFVGKTMEFKVVKINAEFKNVVVSHKVLIEEELETQKLEIMSKLEKGQVLEGTVKNITSYGVFMDLGGVDGLLHITDISWGRINHPEEVLKLDDKINVVILDFDGDKKRIALGLKQLTPQPWEALDANIKEGDKIKGKVVVLTDYGAFIEIIPGVEGLIHVSEMSWSQHLRSPQDFLKAGDEVETLVLSVDREERKMSLGLKQLSPDPWGNIDEKYPVGSRHSSKVRNFTTFGVFVELEEGIDGLIHISDLSWSKKIKHPSEFTKVGETIDVLVLDVDKEHRRLSLGHKQLEDNPWDTYETIFTTDSIHDAVVGKVTDKGATVMFPNFGVEGFAHYKQLTKENGSPAKQDETLSFKVTEFNKENKRIVVSHVRTYDDKRREEKAGKEKEFSKERDETSNAVKKLKDTQEKSTLGDMDVLSQLKDTLEIKEKKTKKAAAATSTIANTADNSPAATAAETVTDNNPVATDHEEATPTAPVADIEPAAETTVTVANEGADAATIDDLKTINGIGPAFEAKLLELGVDSYAKLASLTLAEVEDIEIGHNLTSMEEWQNWIDQAKELAGK